MACWTDHLCFFGLGTTTFSVLSSSSLSSQARSEMERRATIRAEGAMVETCPDPKLLRRFTLGEISPAECDALASHIEHCSHCVQRLHCLEASDSLLEAMQHAVAGGIGSES